MKTDGNVYFMPLEVCHSFRFMRWIRMYASAVVVGWFFSINLTYIWWWCGFVQFLVVVEKIGTLVCLPSVWYVFMYGINQWKIVTVVHGSKKIPRILFFALFYKDAIYPCNIVIANQQQQQPSSWEAAASAAEWCSRITYFVFYNNNKCKHSISNRIK